MNEIFVDTHHFAAALNLKDQWYELASAVEAEIGDARLVTTETVIHEFLNFFADFPPRMKKRAADLSTIYMKRGRLKLFRIRRKHFSTACGFTNPDSTKAIA